MKKALFILALACMAHFANAQKVPMSSNGYWVIESSKQTPKQSIIRFYNLNNELVYQETVNGKKLKINDNRTRIALNNALQVALDGKKHNEPILAMQLPR
ncbi:hypothetical protein BEL04_00995 [Mucilaginibacter sp. PPCGB 2223]|uniref:hypothetical protein n=1 Tax=Mucilaginibacter sp. PPCGB 2223 TaxID=1886027 RepID=UPI0008254B2A|nr:hypothetical protein [Mucilaginibacter sp. PPCGB 2223]OCX52936.1 hypothetical protein BEL04_00995 [Mucilaginibacter sp. PPCGB 2223]